MLTTITKERIIEELSKHIYRLAENGFKPQFAPVKKYYYMNLQLCDMFTPTEEYTKFFNLVNRAEVKTPFGMYRISSIHRSDSSPFVYLFLYAVPKKLPLMYYNSKH